MKRRGTDEERKAYQRAYYHANKEHKKASISHARRKRLYGLEANQVGELFDKANDRCQCCAAPVARPLTGAPAYTVGNIDHCHTTGVVRGILCNCCNQALGLLKDRPELAVAYLKRQT